MPDRVWHDIHVSFHCMKAVGYQVGIILRKPVMIKQLPFMVAVNWGASQVSKIWLKITGSSCGGLHLLNAEIFKSPMHMIP